MINDKLRAHVWQKLYEQGASALIAAESAKLASSDEADKVEAVARMADRLTEVMFARMPKKKKESARYWQLSGSATVCIVSGDDAHGAASAAKVLGCLPDGNLEARAFPVGTFIPEEWVGRILSRDELAMFDVSSAHS